MKMITRSILLACLLSYSLLSNSLLSNIGGSELLAQSGAENYSSTTADKAYAEAEKSLQIFVEVTQNQQGASQEHREASQKIAADRFAGAFFSSGFYDKQRTRAENL